MKEKNDNKDNEKGIEVDSNENIIDINKNFTNIKKLNKQNYGELTKEQFELMKKIRDDTISRTERYSELINDQISNDIFLKFTDTNKKKKKNTIKHSDNSSLQTNNTIGIIDNPKKEEINPNKERIYHSSQPILFIKGEPAIILGPDTIYFVEIFSFVSFLSIIIYSLKNSYLILKILFIGGYLFFMISYILLLFKNPGIPKNKNKLEPTMLQRHYQQCQQCNCISVKKDGKLALHCDKCNICVEPFYRHCKFATKCIGKGNSKYYKIWLYSIGAFFVISLIYLVF